MVLVLDTLFWHVTAEADKGKLYFIQLNDGSIPLDIQAGGFYRCTLKPHKLPKLVG